MSSNPNMPAFDEAIAWTFGPQTGLPAVIDYNKGWMSILNRTEGTWETQRGRQYELDQIQTGTASSTVRNDDGLFDPLNSASPLWFESPQSSTAVQPYRCYRRRAQYPATRNILTPDQANAANPLASTGVPLDVEAALPGVTVSGGAYVQPVPYGTSGFTQLLIFGGWSVTPGDTYTASCLAYANAAVSRTVAMQLVFYDINGLQITSTIGTPVTLLTGGLFVTVTATAPANAVVGFFGLYNPTIVGLGHGGTNFYTNVQLEVNASQTAFVSPGTWYNLYTGYVERFEEGWAAGGNYGTVALSCVDAFGYLSQRMLLSPAYMELLTLSPNWFYPLDEESDAAAFVDLSANQNPINIYVPPGTSLLQTLTPGTDIAVGAGAVLPSGIGGPVIGSARNTSGTFAAQLIDFSTSFVGPQSSSWTRIYAFSAPTDAALEGLFAPIMSCQSAVDATLIEAYATYAPTGQPVPGELANLTVNLYNSAGTNVATATAAAELGGGWHLLMFGVSGSTFSAYIDGVAMASSTSGSLSQAFASGGWDVFGGILIQNSGTYAVPGINGQLAYAAELPILVTSTQASLLYSTFQYGGSGLGAASSASRFADVLRWADWPGPSAIDNFTSGTTVLYGPSVDLQATQSDQGTDTVSALQTVVDTDNGSDFVSTNGSVTFKARKSRYNLTPVCVLGENTGAGEIPYLSVGFGLDPTLLTNDAALTQTFSQITYRVLQDTSIETFGDIQLQRNVNTLDLTELNAAAEYLLLTEAFPAVRITTLVLDLIAYPSAWPTALAFEEGTCVQVNRRPPNAPEISYIGIIENLHWEITGGPTPKATLTLQISPNFTVNQQSGVWNTSVWSVPAGSIHLTCTSSAGSITPTGSSFTNNAGSYPLTILVDQEQITLNNNSGGGGGTFTSIVRGANGTTAAAHSSAAVSLVAAGLWSY